MARGLERRRADRRVGWLASGALWVSCLAAGCAPALSPADLPLGQPTPGAHTALDREARAWVERTLRGLSVEEKAAQLVTVPLPPATGHGRPAEAQALRRLVEMGAGGLLAPGDFSAATAARLNELQARARHPLLVASELETGASDSRLAWATPPLAQLASADTLPGLLASLQLPAPRAEPLGAAGARLPPALALGAIGEERFSRQAGRIAGMAARAAGVHVAFAPALHLNGGAGSGLDPRSFGEEPAQVARLAVAFLGGLQESGLLSAVRPDVSDLLPFRRAVQAGVDAVLLDRDPERAFGFEGLGYADARGVSTRGPVDRPVGPGAGEAAVRALEAGADVILAPADPEAAIRALAGAVRSGRIPEERLDASVRRLLEAKARAGLHRGRQVEVGSVPGLVGAPEHADFMGEAARSSLVVARDVEGRIPLDPTTLRTVLSVTVADGADPMAGLAFDRTLAAGGFELRSGRVAPGAPVSAWDSLAAAAADADLVLVSLYAWRLEGEGAAGTEPRDGARVAEPLARFLERVRAAGEPALLLSFGSPHLLASLPEASGTLIAWGDGELWQRVAADALLGRGSVAGRLPVSLPPFHRRGEGLRRPLAELSPMAAGAAEVRAAEAGMSEEALARVDRILQAAVADSLTPGAALAVGRSGKLVRLRGYGHSDWAAGAAQVTDSTLYDLASITKAVGTATAVLLLAEEGRLSLDDRASRWLPEWRGGPLEPVTLRDLLLHRSGLPPSIAFWREHRGKEAYRRVLARVPLLFEPGERTLYSDLGYVALGLVAEEASGRPLDGLLEERLFGPLGLGDTGFRPPARLKARIAPTEVDTAWRGFHLHGEVHDENAYAMGGVAGHAGLFSSARDMAAFASLLLEGGRGILSERTVRLLSRPPEEPGSRTYGWEASAASGSGGRHLSYRAFGHTGFTGTSLWIDPELDLYIVLLTNRVNPSRHREGSAALRRAVHEAVVRAIQDGPSS